MITYCEKCESNIDTDKPCKHVIYQKPITITTPATKPLDEQIDDIIRLGVELGTDDGQPYIKYTEAAVDDLEALITNAEKQARIDELSQVSYIGGTLANKNQDILDRIQELENL